MNQKQQQMGSFLERAKKVMKVTDAISPINSKYIPTISESARLDGVSSDIESYDQQLYSQPDTTSYSEASKFLPGGIFESFATNPIDTGMGGLSVLDGIIPQQPQRQSPQPQRQQTYESYEDERPLPDFNQSLKQLKEKKGMVQQPVYQPQQSIGGIDYSVISAIIKTAIAEEIGKLKNTILTESKNGGGGEVIIKMGDDIKFITNNGNVYKGNLKKIGKLKDA